MTERKITPKSTAPSPAPVGDFATTLRAGVALCASVRDAVVSILRHEESNPVWSSSGGRNAIRYEQEAELEELLKKHVTLEIYNNKELPHQVKLALADVLTNQHQPKGALFRLLAETIEIAGPAELEYQSFRADRRGARSPRRSTS